MNSGLEKILLGSLLIFGLLVTGGVVFADHLGIGAVCDTGNKHCLDAIGGCSIDAGQTEGTCVALEDRTTGLGGDCTLDGNPCAKGFGCNSGVCFRSTCSYDASGVDKVDGCSDNLSVGWSGSECARGGHCIEVPAGTHSQLPRNTSDSAANNSVPEKGNDILSLMATAGNWVFAVLITVAVIFILMAAFDFITGQGDPEKMSSARQKIIFAAIGFGVALIATGLDNVIGNILGIS